MLGAVSAAQSPGPPGWPAVSWDPQCGGEGAAPPGLLRAAWCPLLWFAVLHTPHLVSASSGCDVPLEVHQGHRQDSGVPWLVHAGNTVTLKQAFYLSIVSCTDKRINQNYAAWWLERICPIITTQEGNGGVPAPQLPSVSSNTVDEHVCLELPINRWCRTYSRVQLCFLSMLRV